MGNIGTSCDYAVEEFIERLSGRALTCENLAAAAEDAAASRKSQREFINKVIRGWSGAPDQLRKAARCARAEDSLEDYCKAILERLCIRGVVRELPGTPLPGVVVKA